MKKMHNIATSPRRRRRLLATARRASDRKHGRISDLCFADMRRMAIEADQVLDSLAAVTSDAAPAETIQ